MGEFNKCVNFNIADSYKKCNIHDLYILITFRVFCSYMWYVDHRKWHTNTICSRLRRYSNDNTLTVFWVFFQFSNLITEACKAQVNKKIICRINNIIRRINDIIMPNKRDNYVIFTIKKNKKYICNCCKLSENEWVDIDVTVN
jgi:hypothetical protein